MSENNTVLEVNDLKKYYGDVRATDHVSFDVESQEVLSLVGANGAGKTTLINLISGLTKPDSGTIKLLGERINQLAPYERVRKGLVKTFQLTHSFEELTVLDSVRASLLPLKGKDFAFSDLEGEDSIREKAESLIDRFNLTDLKDTVVQNISHGDKKVLDIVSSIATDPNLLLVDEPTSGVGEEEKREVMELLMDYVREHQISAFIIEHDLDLVRDFFEKTYVLHRGSIIARGTPEEVFNNDKVIEVLVGRGR